MTAERRTRDADPVTDPRDEPSGRKEEGGSRSRTPEGERDAYTAPGSIEEEELARTGRTAEGTADRTTEGTTDRTTGRSVGTGTATAPPPTSTIEEPARPPETRARPGDGRGPTHRSIPDLLRELSGEGADLVRQEVALAKAEMSEKVDVFERNLLSMGVGIGFILAGVVFLLWAINYGLTALLTQWVGLEIAAWLAPLILAALAVPIGWAMWNSGKRSLRKEGVTPHKTMETLQRDRRWAEREAHKLREAMTHG